MCSITTMTLKKKIANVIFLITRLESSAIVADQVETEKELNNIWQ